MSKYKLLILTEPVLDYRNKPVYAHLRNYKWKFFPRKKAISGHYAVTRSLLNGLKLNKVPYLYNEPLDYRLPENVFVLSGIEALKQAIELKKGGVIKRLFAGPNLVVKATDNSSILGNENIDFVVANSQWIKKAYAQQLPKIADKIIVWPAGVDTDFWQDLTNLDKEYVLIYNKNWNEEELQKLLSVFEGSGAVKIISYGSYKAEQYKQDLSMSKMMVYLSSFESQGIALAEAWAMNVPTLIAKPHSSNYHGWQYSEISSAPYLTGSTGKLWNNMRDLEAILKNFDTFKFAPREWVVENMSDSVTSAKLICNINV